MRSISGRKAFTIALADVRPVSARCTHLKGHGGGEGGGAAGARQQPRRGVTDGTGISDGELTGVETGAKGKVLVEQATRFGRGTICDS